MNKKCMHYYEVTKLEMIAKILQTYKLDNKQYDKFKYNLKNVADDDFKSMYIAARNASGNKSIDFLKDIYGPICSDMVQDVRYYKSAMMGLPCINKAFETKTNKDGSVVCKNEKYEPVRKLFEDIPEFASLDEILEVCVKAICSKKGE